MKMLVPGSDYHLQEEAVPNKHDLPACLGDFLDLGLEEIYIAVVCGMPMLWSTNEFAGKMRIEQGVDALLITEDFSGDIFATSKCVATRNEDEAQQSTPLWPFFSTIIDLLKKIAQRMKPHEGNDEWINIARSGINEACGMMRTIKKTGYSLKDDEFAKTVSNLLSVGSDEESGGNKNGFPTVRILVFLPGSMFKEFEDPNRFFFSQITRVLLFENPEVSKLKLEIEGLKQEAEELKQELDEANAAREKSEAENTELVKRIAKLEQRIAELEQRAAELVQQVEKLQAEQNRISAPELEAMFDAVLSTIEKIHGMEHVQTFIETMIKENPNLSEFIPKGRRNPEKNRESHIVAEQNIGTETKDSKAEEMLKAHNPTEKGHLDTQINRANNESSIQRGDDNDGR